jgi:RNA polymerase sigma-70 factor (ECF subfamily)
MSRAVDQLEGLYRAHGPALLVYLRRATGRQQLAEDLLHETFVHALRSVDRLAEVVSPRAWLFRIARNVTVSAGRRRRPAIGLPEQIAAPDAAGGPADLEGMRLAIAGLPDKLRETLELRLRDELSYEEIAAVLAIPVGTVRSRLHHAVRQLRDVLTGTHIDEDRP